MQTAYLKRTLELAVDNVRAGGGPFAALVVKDGQVIASGVNRVTATNDPTAHAEIVAIRDACRTLGSFQLDGCEVYCSCEPCPMCLGALYWARPERVYFAATRDDAGAAGFDDSAIYREIALPPSQRLIPIEQVADEQAGRPFEAWVGRPDRQRY